MGIEKVGGGEESEMSESVLFTSVIRSISHGVSSRIRVLDRKHPLSPHTHARLIAPIKQVSTGFIKQCQLVNFSHDAIGFLEVCAFQFVCNESYFIYSLVPPRGRHHRSITDATNKELNLVVGEINSSPIGLFLYMV
jgi:hypothetical protein